MHILRAVLVAMMLASCSGVPGAILGTLSGGGPNVAANVQAGKTNSQTVGQSEVNEQKITNPEADQVVQDNSTNSELPTWVWIVGITAFVVGWATDTPGTMLRQLVRRENE